MFTVQVPSFFRNGGTMLLSASIKIISQLNNRSDATHFLNCRL